MEVIAHVGILPLRFGMKRNEVLALLGSQQTHESWMGGNLEDALYYPGLLVHFVSPIVRCTPNPLDPGHLAHESAEVSAIEANASLDASFEGRHFRDLTKTFVCQVLSAKGVQIKRTPGGTIHCPGLDMEFRFDHDGSFWDLSMEARRRK